MRNRQFGTALVVRTPDADELQRCTDEVIELVRGLGAEPTVSEGEVSPARDPEWNT